MAKGSPRRLKNRYVVQVHPSNTPALPVMEDVCTTHDKAIRRKEVILKNLRRLGADIAFAVSIVNPGLPIPPLNPEGETPAEWAERMEEREEKERPRGHGEVEDEVSEFVPSYILLADADSSVVYAGRGELGKQAALNMYKAVMKCGGSATMFQEMPHEGAEL